MTRIIDISVPLFTAMVYYPGDLGVSIEPGKQISKGDTANLSGLHMGSHSGTHVDAPHHFIEGKGTVDQMPLEVLIGPVRVLDLTGIDSAIYAEDLKKAGIDGAERVLFKTRNSSLWKQPEFQRDFVFLADDGADLLVESGVSLAGIDYLSIEQFRSETYYVHRRLLGSGVVVLEGVDLSSVEPGDFELCCLPLKIIGGDGAPARAVLIGR